jgi:hypothetical protein
MVSSYKTEDTIMRKCYICKEEKEFTEFYKDKTQVAGHSYECKKCKSEISKKRREENPEKYREQNRRSLEKNYESIRASQKRFRLENRERILKRRKELREPRRKEINAREYERRKNDPKHLEKMRILNKKNREKNKEINKPKRSAHKLVMYAVKLGILKKPKECEICQGTIRIEGHHKDYTKPLEVQWLCKSCHVKEHVKERN